MRTTFFLAGATHWCSLLLFVSIAGYASLPTGIFDYPYPENPFKQVMSSLELTWIMFDSLHHDLSLKNGFDRRFLADAALGRLLHLHEHLAQLLEAEPISIDDSLYLQECVTMLANTYKDLNLPPATGRLMSDFFDRCSTLCERILTHT